ncbi:MAG: Eco57I restriction-modification methylase domain-containing protein [Candidatus Margulisbacteria bacterium]|nr:Eco57I restriction-modification methylase domain-containing protein [Candidatus Margulisiibacteriota bacterium]
MNRLEAIRIIEDTFDKAFNEEKFLYFVRNLFNDLNEAKKFPQPLTGSYIKDAFKGKIRSYKRLGQYTAPNGVVIDIIVAELTQEYALDHARTSQRNFAADYLKTRGNKEIGLFIYYSPDRPDWRFSLVKRELKTYQKASGKVAIAEDLVPAKRFSFLVGENEPNHTAKKQLLPLLENEQKNPSLKDIEQAFNIETISDEFFEKYKELYGQLKESLDKLAAEQTERGRKIKEDFENKNIDTVDFAKKLLGQLVFLYFLQKKGWLGVDRSGAWGEGSRSFLRDLFDGKYVKYENFFNDVLEPLFYEGLAYDRGETAFYNGLKCRLPFLNGGLFDPLQDYSWEKTDICIPNEIFSNKTADNVEGTGILDIFDLYNFTIKEDEPLDKEVAIDPEMLGKVFERLLPVKERKSQAAFYTPREIVHYMCQQSLINYLAAELKNKTAREDIENFILQGELAADNTDSGGYAGQLPRSIKNNYAEIDKLLENLKICDPAIGSGAFPVGMMTEIIAARNALTQCFSNKQNRTLYNFKRHAIQESIYGVDLDASAVDIAKLRLWLSLIVDETDMKNIQPLPNLDYKIMQGNSLLEEFEGVKLFDENFLAKSENLYEQELKNIQTEQLSLQKEFYEYGVQVNDLVSIKKKGREISDRKKILDKRARELRKLLSANGSSLEDTLFNQQSAAKKKLEKYQAKQKEFFDSVQKSEKKKLLQELGELEWELIEATLKEQHKTNSLKKLEQYKKARTKPFFLWKLHFAEVFQEKGGFDVVIANPPYGILNKKQNKAESIVVPPEELEYYKNSLYYEPATGRMINIFRLFILKSLRLLSSEGIFMQIFPLAFTGDLSITKLRKYILENCSIIFIEAFPERDNENKRVFRDVKMSVAITCIKNTKTPDNFFVRINTDKYIDVSAEKNYINKGIIELFDDNSYTIPLMSSKETSLLQKVFTKSTKFSDIGWCYTGEIDMTFCKAAFTKSSKDTVLLRGAILDRYIIKDKMSQGEILYIDENKLRKTKKIDKSVFSSERIVMQGITGVNEKIRLKMMIIKDVYCANSVNFLVLNKDVNNKYLLGIFNSKLMNFIFKKFSTNSNVNGYEINNLPIRLQSYDEQKIISIVDQILTVKRKLLGTFDLEAQLDKLVYEIYELSPEEIKIVEESLR